MALTTMYQGQANSPQAIIDGAITDSQTSITVIDASILPTAPNLLVIGGNVENAETVKVTDITGNVLTVERAFEGTAKAWDSGSLIGRNFTAYDYNTLADNIDELDSEVLKRLKVYEDTSGFFTVSSKRSDFADFYDEDIFLISMLKGTVVLICKWDNDERTQFSSITMGTNQRGVYSVPADDSLISILSTTNFAIDNLSSTSEYPLSANQGKVLNDDLVAHKADYTAHSDFVLNNSVVNGDFSDGTTGWIENYATLTILNGIGTIAGEYNNSGFIQYINFIQNNKYFVYASMQGTNYEIKLRESNVGVTEYTTGDLSSVGFNDVYFTRTITTTPVATIQIVTDGVNIIKVDGNAGVFAINMTALGIEDYTEEEMLAFVKNGYFEGIYKPTQKELTDWQMTLIRQNKELIDGLLGV